MNKLLLACTAFSLCMFSSSAFGQVTGIQTVPGSFPTIQAAVAALNATGVGSGGATINIAAGYTETPTAALVLNMPINGPSAGNPLVFQKFGAGANPLITAFTPGVSTALDGIFVLAGVDYVTIDGIDVQENALNTTATMQMEWGYALVKTGGTNGANYNTIKNCSVTLNKSNAASVGIYLSNHTSASVTSLTVTSVSGTSSNNKFYNNTVQNAYTGISITGYASAAPFDLYDQGNEVGVDGVSTRRNQVINYGGGGTTANGIFATNQTRIKIFKTYVNSTGGATSSGILNGISLGTGTNSNVDVYNDTITLSSASGTGSALTGIANVMGGTGQGSIVNIYNNIVSGCTYPTNTSGEFRGISSTATATYTNMYNNQVTGNIIPGTGNFSGIFYGGSSVNVCLAVNINGNTVSGNSKTGTGGSFRMISADAATVATNVYNNQLFNNSATATSSTMYAYYNFGVGLAENIYNNTIYNNAGGTGETYMLYVASGTTTGSIVKQVFGNTIYGISGNTVGSSVGAIYVSYGVVVNVNNNIIYDITNNTVTGTTGATVGINIANFINQQVSVYNNFVSELKAPSANNTNAVYGIWLQGTSVSSITAYYNSVYLNGTSAGGNFGTSALVCTTAPASIDMRNNILVNVSTPAGTGVTSALLRTGGVSLANYATTSGYNCLYAGTPGPANLIFSDGTNNDQTLQNFKNRVGPREQSSFSSLPPFVNVAVSPYDLHLQTSIATQCQGGAAPIAGQTIDFDGNVRNVTTPDVGADEFAGITTDIAAPNIQYIPLTNSSVAVNRPCTNFATITDPSGINTTAGTRPRLYYRRTTNANTYNNNTNGTDGWKYVEATNTSSPFSFTIDYTLLFGGGVVAGDVIQYFVVAQDLAGVPIVGINSGGFTTQPTTVNLTAANFPLNNMINQYTIVPAALSGVINVGPAELITSLTNVGGIFQAINASTLSGNLTINITGDLTAETGTVALNQWAEEGVGGYTVSIVPSAATTRNIYGSNAAAALIRFDGADRVNIDGRFASAGTFLMFRNTSNAAPTIGFLNDARNNTVQYTIVESGNTATSITLGGAIWLGSTTGPDGNDNITISNCEIRDRSDLPGTSNFAINCTGNSTGTLAQYNNNLVVTNCNIHDWFLLNGTTQYAINVQPGNSGFTISGNSFYQTTTRTNTTSATVSGIRAINISFTATMASNGGHVISGNFIGGTAPGAAGSDMILTVSGANVAQQFGAISVITGLIPNSIQGNVIRRIDFTTNSPAGNTTMWFGMNLGQGIHNVGTTAGNTMGDGAVNGSLKITINAGGVGASFFAGFLAATVNGSYVIQNNTIAGITVAGTTTSAIIPQWIQIQGTPSASSVITGNTIGSTTVANSIQNNIIGAQYLAFAIRHLTNTGPGFTITGNTIQNLTDNSTSVSSAHYGILLVTPTGTGSSGQMTVTSNTIREISMAGGATTPVLGHMGISIQGMSGINHTFSNNLIAGLHCSNTGAAQNYAVGIQTQGNAMGGVMNANRIFDIRNSNTGANPGIIGIYMNAGANWTLSNNMISITNGTNTNLVDMGGIVEFLGQSAVMNLYYNSIYLGGSTGSGTLNTACYLHASNSTVTLRNNLFYNKRTGGTGFHVALANSSATPTNGWQPSSSNYNAFIVSDTTRIGLWVTSFFNMSAWRGATGGDMNSIWETSTTVSSAALFVNANGNLHINTSTYPEALGTPLTAVTVDYDGDPRSPSFPTIGADELACSAIVFGVLSQTNVTCNGDNDGAASVAGTGGNGITYAWAPTGGNAATATGLSSGTYTVTISNICGSIGTVTVNITEPAVITANPTQTNVTCNGANDGTATVAATGGTGAYTYLWSPTGGTGATESALAPGTYSVTITDANSCTTTQSFTITEPAVLAATTMQTDVLCNGASTGDAMVMVTGGTGAYTYSWAPSGGTNALATGLAAGTYTVTITDANSCTMNQSFTLTEPPALAATTMQTNVSCNGGNDGDAMVMVSGGTGAYTYSWAPSGGTNAMATGLSMGTYTVTITDANNCTMSQSFSIIEPSTLTASSMQNDVSCNGGSDGDAMVMVSGGTGAYTYSWAPSGGTAATATGLAMGTYTVTVTDANNCTMTQSFNITEPAVLSATATTATGPTTCAGTDGLIDLTVSGGSGPFTFVWNTSDLTEDISGLVAGVYSVIITDANGCLATDTTTLNDPPLPTVTLALPIDSACQTTTAPFTLTGESPAGGTFTGPGVTAGVFDPNQANIGMNVITYAYTDPNGCSGSITDSIYVDICMGIPSVEGGNFVVYPNPNTGSFIVQLNTAEAADVMIYDALGQLVSAQKVQPKVQHPVEILNSGAYMITVITADGQRTTQRVIVTR